MSVKSDCNKSQKIRLITPAVLLNSTRVAPNTFQTPFLATFDHPQEVIYPWNSCAYPL